MSASLCVVKVGGSLYDLPDLGVRLRSWLTLQPWSAIILVPGGGATANVVRQLDRVQQLGEEAAHWIALRALTLNAHFLADVLPQARVIDDPCAADAPRWSILDCHAFARADEGRPDHLPHSWSVTSDSIAARAARVSGAGELILLKSIAIPPGIDWSEASRLGWVDSYFAEAVRGLIVRSVNFRNLDSCCNAAAPRP
jgi:aspartokinase-like uncharacterized kinase